MDGRRRCVCIHSYDLSVIEYIIHFLIPGEKELRRAYLFSEDKNSCSTDSQNG